MAGEHYSAFIKEAFVKPIRSVLIVDDDYPTFDEVLRAQIAKNEGEEIKDGKDWHKNPKRIRQVIKNFRQNNPPLLVDIHDGTNVGFENEANSARHLHQCDLLVLDYELEKDKQGDGRRAVQILRGLMYEGHFNLVVIYTNEDLDVAFEVVLWGLIDPSPDSLSAEETERAEKLIEEGEDHSKRFEERLRESVDSAQYFYSRKNPKTYARTMSKGRAPYSEFKELCDSVLGKLFKESGASAGSLAKARKLILRYFLKDREAVEFKKADRSEAAESDEWYYPSLWSSDSIKWIKSDSAFIAFSNKKVSDGDLLVDLQKALDDWNPRPSRLLLTKLRAEMDEHGIAAQGRVLSNRLALAYWYYRLLRAGDRSDQRWRVAESVSRHSEQLMGAVLPDVEKFVLRLIEEEGKGGDDAARICEAHFEVNLADEKNKREAILEHNAFVCSKAPEGWHLDTGHIFVMCDEHWVCLSPACDMVPRPSSQREETFGARLQFIAVPLRKIPAGKVLEDIQTNRYVFVRIDGEVKVFCFNEQVESAPQWHALYAEDTGRFSGEDFRLDVSRIEPGEDGLIAKTHEARVVGQLRYEYALNLIQKLGVSLTRIGLDFAG